MVCDIGGGTTDVAVFSLADIVASRSIRISLATKWTMPLLNFWKAALVPSASASRPPSRSKIEIGSAAPLDQELTAEVRGRDIIGGVPRKAVVTSEEIREALVGPIGAILACLKSAIEQCDPELVADLVDQGVVLTGGGALLRGLDVHLSEQLNVPAARRPRSVDDRRPRRCDLSRPPCRLARQLRLRRKGPLNKYSNERGASVPWYFPHDRPSHAKSLHFPPVAGRDLDRRNRSTSFVPADAVRPPRPGGGGGISSAMPFAPVSWLSIRQRCRYAAGLDRPLVRSHLRQLRPTWKRNCDR